jgi:hypothetical protein
VLIFARFKPKSKEEELTIWHKIKGKINSKCRSERFNSGIKAAKGKKLRTDKQQK